MLCAGNQTTVADRSCNAGNAPTRQGLQFVRPLVVKTSLAASRREELM